MVDVFIGFHFPVFLLAWQIHFRVAVPCFRPIEPDAEGIIKPVFISTTAGIPGWQPAETREPTQGGFAWAPKTGTKCMPPARWPANGH
jgi:hypothetical protein